MSDPRVGAAAAQSSLSQTLQPRSADVEAQDDPFAGFDEEEQPAVDSTATSSATPAAETATPAAEANTDDWAAIELPSAVTSKLTESSDLWGLEGPASSSEQPALAFVGRPRGAEFINGRWERVDGSVSSLV